MPRNPSKCKHCKREVLFTVIGVKQHDDGTLGPNRRAFDLDPVPTSSCVVMAVVLRRDRTLQDVALVSNPPPECYPIHRCPQALEALALEQDDRLLAGRAVTAVIDDLIDSRPIQPPPAAPARRRESIA